MASKSIKTLFNSVSPASIMVIITHCDKSDPSEDWIFEKNSSFNLGILRENTFKFKKSAESLVPMMKEIKPISSRPSLNLTNYDQKVEILESANIMSLR